MSDSPGEQEKAGVDGDRRIKALDERLEQLETREAVRTGQGKSAEADPNYRLGNRVIADLIGGIAGGALVGWVIDRFFDTGPWGFMIFLALGIVVAFRNIFRLANGAAITPRDDGED